MRQALPEGLWSSTWLRDPTTQRSPGKAERYVRFI